MVLTRHLDEQTVETTASGTLRLPAELPDVARPIHWRAFACVEQVKADPQGGRVEAAGRVRVWLTYAAAGSEAAEPAGALFGGRLEGDLGFVARAEAPPGSEAAAWDVRWRVVDVEGRVRGDGRSADVDVVLQVAFEGAEPMATAVVTQAAATEPCRVEATSVQLRPAALVALERGRITLSDGWELPVPRGAGRARILQADAAVSLSRAQAEDGGVALEGSVRYDVMFAFQRPARAGAGGGEEEGEADEAATEVAEEPGWEVGFSSWSPPEPFQVTLPAAAVRPGQAVRARAAVSDLVVRATGDGRVELAAEVQLEAIVEAALTLQAVTDIRGCEQLPVEQRKVSLVVESPLPEARRSFAASATLELPNGQSPVDRLVWCGVHLEPQPVRVEGNRAFVVASATPWMYYVPYKAGRDAGLVYVSWPSAITVEQAVALADTRSHGAVRAWVLFGGVSAEADLINRQTVEFSVAGVAVVHARQRQEQEVVAEAVAVPVRGGEPAPFFYLVVTQPGDTLWKLSRRYDTSPEALARSNPELGGLELSAPLAPGRRLFVHRHG